MNLGEMKVLARDLLGEKGEYWPSAQMDRIANTANRMVYRSVTNIDPSYFGESKRITYPADATEVSLDNVSYLGTSPYKVLDVAHLGTDAAVSSSNQPVSLEYIRPDEQYNSPSTLHDPHFHQYGSRFYLRWTLEGDNDLKLISVPASEVYLYVRYVRHPRTLSGSTDELLHPDNAVAATTSYAEEFHDLVLVTFTKLLTMKERRQGGEITELYVWVQNEVRQAENTRSNTSKMLYESPY